MYEDIRTILEESGVSFIADAPMRDYTSFRIGGPADYLILPRNTSELKTVVAVLRRAGCPVTMMGNGSNLLVRDGGIRGAVIRTAGAMTSLKVSGRQLAAGPGVLLGVLASFAFKNGLVGLEFAAGIPGTLGGAVYMNAGAYGGEISQLIKSVTYLDETLALHTRPKKAFDFGYRHSLFMERSWMIVSAVLSLEQGDAAAARKRADELNQRRRDKQPLDLPSAGSVFKRPEDNFAGALIERAGLKGRSVGGARVSEKHAGFIVNTGGATAADVLELCAIIEDEVEKMSGIRLVRELRVIGEDG